MERDAHKAVQQANKALGSKVLHSSNTTYKKTLPNNATHISHILLPAPRVLLHKGITLLNAVHSKPMTHVVLPVTIIHCTRLLPHLGALACTESNGSGWLVAQRGRIPKTALLRPHLRSTYNSVSIYYHTLRAVSSLM